jgi:hypothetical protein
MAAHAAMEYYAGRNTGSYDFRNNAEVLGNEEIV